MYLRGTGIPGIGLQHLGQHLLMVGRAGRCAGSTRSRVLRVALPLQQVGDHVRHQSAPREIDKAAVRGVAGLDAGEVRQGHPDIRQAGRVAGSQRLAVELEREIAAHEHRQLVPRLTPPTDRPNAQTFTEPFSARA